MPTRITQVEAADGSGTVLRIEGSLALEDAALIERLCRDLRAQTGREITLDLADLSFLDSDSASVLRRLKCEHGVRLEGLHLFVQQAIEMAEQDSEQ
jgi:anti-anti-sigma regulatory factor